MEEIRNLTQATPSNVKLEWHVRPRDELANFITHGLGLLLSVPASILLLWLVRGSASPEVVLACEAYVASLVGVYAASTLSHAFHDPLRRRFYQTLDQACIYFLIAGNFTPFCVMFPGANWDWLLPTMWIMAATGALLVYWTRNYQGLPKIIPYVLFGWFPALGIQNVVAQAPSSVVVWLVLGGLLYTLGVLFLLNDHRVRYFHALWHALVIAASACHYVAVLESVMSTQPHSAL